jgi:hypothetical protein
LGLAAIAVFSWHSENWKAKNTKISVIERSIIAQIA